MFQWQYIRKTIKESPTLTKWYLKYRYGTLLKKGYGKKIKGKSNQIILDKSSFLNGCMIEIIGNDNSIQIDGGAVLNHVRIYIKGNSSKINLSGSVRFNRGGELWIEDDHCLLNIDEGSTFEDVHLAVTESHSRLIIGKDCMFSNYIDVRTGDSHSILDNESRQRINPAKNVLIGNHVWVGAHVSILKGSEINDNSIVATRSVVTKKFSDKYILIGGIPAKVLKENVDWDRARL